LSRYWRKPAGRICGGGRRAFPGFAPSWCRSSFPPAARGRFGGRLESAFDPFHHDSLRLARAPKLARLGLSKPKIKTLKAIGAAVSKGVIDLDAIGRMQADDAHAALIALHGIGPWTADIYLLFCLGHADAWPAGDLALQEAARIAFGLDARPDTKQMIALAEAWRPWRGVAAHLLWAYYAALKRRDPVPAQPNSKVAK
jgi:DNA-3-methyladenine glycosylase II